MSAINQSISGPSNELVPRIKYKHLVKEIGSDPERGPMAKVLAMKTKLQSALQDHYTAIGRLCPALAALVDLTPDEPHLDGVLLPSTLTEQQRVECALDRPARVEMEMRIGHAYDCLDAIRKALSLRSFLSRHTKRANGHVMTTKSMESIRRANHKVQTYAQAYRKTFTALKALGTRDPRMSCLRELEPPDLVMLATWLEEGKYSSREEQSRLPWIWTMAPLYEEGEVGAGPNEDIAGRVNQWNQEGWLHLCIIHRSLELISSSHSVGMGSRSCGEGTMGGRGHAAPGGAATRDA